MNSKEKIEQLKRDAAVGNASAQNALACAYYNGDGVEKDIPTAMSLFEKSAAGGDNYGLSNLAYRYRYGKDGYAKDLKKAFDLYLQAAEQGHVSAQETVGIFYDFGYGVKENKKKAVEWYTKAATRGQRVAQNNLGSKYKQGLGVERNYHKAFDWYMKAALQGEEYAMCNIGIMYEEGKGVPVNYKSAVYWYEKSANKGHERAANRLKELRAKYDEDIDKPCLNFPRLAENPFRMLGVFSNSSMRDISANKSKMSVFLKIGKPVELPTDKLSEYPVHRTEDTIESAARSISQPLDRLVYALFWFIETGENDRNIFEALSHGDTEKAIGLCDEETMSSLMNGAVISLFLDDYGQYVSNLTKLIHDYDYRKQFATAVCGDNFEISEDDLAHLLIDILIAEIPSVEWKKVFYDNGVSAVDDDYVSEKLAQLVVADIETQVNECSNISQDEGAARNDGAVKLKNSTQTKLQDIEYFVGKDSFLYQSCADKVAQELMNCAIDYYKKCKDTIYSATQSCYDLIKYADSIAAGTTLKEKTQENLNQIKKRLDCLPPESSFELFVKVNEIISNYEAKEETVKNALALLQECAPFLAEIKENLGRTNKAYIDISTLVANLALSNSIEEINAKFKEIDKENNKKITFAPNPYSPFGSTNMSYLLDSLRKLIENTWKLFLNIEKLDLDETFVEKRYKTNKDIVADYVRDFRINTFLIRADIDMRTETEIFKGCATIAQYKQYMSRFPSGKYIKEANEKIRLLTEQDDNYWTACSRSGNYSDYLTKYPYGLHSYQAKTEQEKKQKEEDERYWTACSKNGDYGQYIEKYPQGIHIKEAEEAKQKKEIGKADGCMLLFFAIIALIFILYICNSN